MKLGKKHTKPSFMTKPRKGKIFETSEFILNNPKALYILLLMSHLFAFLFFATIFTVLMFNDGDPVLKTIMLMGSGFMLYKLIKYIKFRKHVKDIMGDTTVMSFLKRDKNE